MLATVDAVEHICTSYQVAFRASGFGQANNLWFENKYLHNASCILKNKKTPWIRRVQKTVTFRLKLSRPIHAVLLFSLR